jgi:hypothetical protein
MHRSLMLCAAAGLVAATLFAANPAQASYRVIKWPITNICQIWNFSLPTRPIPPNYIVVSRPIATFGAALRVKEHLWRRGVCLL